MTLEEGKKYRVTGKDDVKMDFIVCTIDRPNDEVYVKIVAPVCQHEGFKLSSVENNPLPIEEVK